MSNPILATDSYKFSHFMQYPPGSKVVSSYVEARGTKIEGVTEVVMFGLQAFIKEYLMKPVTMKDVEEAKLFCEKHGTPFNYEGWKRIVSVHGGFLPIRIDAVPEGTPVPLQNVMIQVHNLDDELPWLTSYVETLLLSHVWYGSTVATLSREIKRTIKHYLELTADKPAEELPFKLHDFGYRGVAAGAAGLGGAAHLVNFWGTDTVAGIEYAMENYNAGVCGYSISASEHSTMTSWGEENEYAAYANMVEQYAKPGAIFACVIDSYDTMRAIRMWCYPSDEQGNKYREDGKTLTQLVKEAGARVVLRPDSGDPVQMPIDVIREIGRYEGFYWNSKGFEVLPDHIRVIQGDGIDHNDLKNILELMFEQNLSASNIAFGMGGGLLQKVNRDTFKFAMKANAINIDGKWKDVVKNPVTDQSKKSKAGRQILLKNKKSGKFITVCVDEASEYRKAGYVRALHQVYGAFGGSVEFHKSTFEQVRDRAAL